MKFGDINSIILVYIFTYVYCLQWDTHFKQMADSADRRLVKSGLALLSLALYLVVLWLTPLAHR